MSKGRKPTELSNAAVHGNFDFLSSALKKFTQRSTSLNGNTSVACPLLETITKINSEEQLKCVELLLREKLIDVNAVNGSKQSSLFLAVLNKDPYALKAFKMLLDHPYINVNPVWGIFDLTPLHTSIQSYVAPEYLELLLAHDGINVKMLTGKGKNVFHLLPSAEKLAMLLQSPKTTHAMITAMDNDGNTPLDIAMKNIRNIDAVELLLPYYLPFFKERVAFLLCNKATDVTLPISVTRLIFSFLNMEQNRTVRNVKDFMTKFVPETERDKEKKQAIMKFLDVYFQ